MTERSLDDMISYYAQDGMGIGNLEGEQLMMLTILRDALKSICRQGEPAMRKIAAEALVKVGAAVPQRTAVDGRKLVLLQFKT